MKVFKIQLAFALLLVPALLFAQPTYTIALDKGLNLDFNPDEGLSTGINMCYELLFPDRIFKNNKSYKIVAPKTDKKLAYGMAGFRGSIQGITNYWAYLISDYDSETPLFYFDHNSNLDFTDDGEPTSYRSDSLLHFFDGRLKAKFLLINIEGQDRLLLKFIEQSNNADDLSKRMFLGKNEKGLHSKFWTRDIVADIAKGNVTIDNKNFEIQILDFDENKKFGTRRDLFFTIENKNGVLIKNYWESKKGIFTLGEEVFAIKSINENGTQLVIEKNANLVAPKKINIDDSIDELSLETTTNFIQLSDEYNKHQFTLLDFWATWCKPCIAAMPELEKLKEDYDAQFGIIGFACDKKSLVEKFEAKQPHSWVNVIASDYLQFQFNILGLPNYYMVDSDGKVVAKLSGVNGIKEFLEKNIKED
uniref:TlpA family protein disulfide reductase n=1 Tax=Roseivirga sp. TaxID=1964215 RepID=UPI004048B1DA